MACDGVTDVSTVFLIFFDFSFNSPHKCCKLNYVVCTAQKRKEKQLIKKKLTIFAEILFYIDYKPFILY